MSAGPSRVRMSPGRAAVPATRPPHQPKRERRTSDPDAEGASSVTTAATAFGKSLEQVLKQEVIVEAQLEEADEQLGYEYSENEFGEGEFPEDGDGDVETVETYYYTEDGDIVTDTGEIAGYIEEDSIEQLEEQVKADGEDATDQDGGVLEVAYKCSVCSDSFFSYDDLRVHADEHHMSALFSCLKCGKVFRGHGNWWRHMNSHSDDPKYRFPCDICHKVFSQKANMLKHMNIHLGVRNFRCMVCDKAFSQKANLNKHMLVHSGTLLYECTVCAKRFSQKANLKKHNQIHTGEYSFECDICHKKFIQKINCQKHMRIHRDLVVRTDAMKVDTE